MVPMLKREFFGNTVETYLISLGVFLVILLGLWAVRTFVLARLHLLAKKTATKFDDLLVGILRHINPVVYLILALSIATRSLALPASVNRLLQLLFVVVLTFKVIGILQELLSFFLQEWLAKSDPDDATLGIVVDNLNKIIRVGLWVAGILFILDNLGIEVTAIMAGFGIGGIAVALAAQAVLGDAFSAFSIFLDKPFKVGDFIIVGDLLGTVEYIGFKTTRIRSLGGEQLIFSNTDLTGSRIKNYKRMEQRRVVFKLGVIYQTPLEKVKAIPGILKRIVEEQKLAKFDRTHFASYGDFALIYEAVFYVLSPDYNQYMDVQQDINFRIKEEFEKQGIEFAYPTQLLYHTKIEPVAASS